jgi:hypothetical protein
MNEDYQTINREYNLNMMDYNRNMRQMFNILSNVYNLNGANSINTPQTYEIPRRARPISSRSRNALELELLTLYMNQITNQINNVSQSPLNNTQIDTYTELITYDLSMNEERCPITHEDFEEGEEICRIISCGHFFKPDAIRRWFLRNTICPVCRHNVLSNSDASNNLTDSPIPQGFFSTLLSNIIPNNDISYNDISYNNVSYNDVSYNTITYTFDIPFNN